MLLSGLARDGGLLLPGQIPGPGDNLDRWRNLSYVELAHDLFRLFNDDFPEGELGRCLGRAYDGFSHRQVTPVSRLGQLWRLELFHGPTLAFKDLALQVLGRLFPVVLSRQGRTLNVLVATSGDTGSAAIHGLRGRPGIRVFVLHPRGRVSPVQERQMTTVLDDNVFNLAVDGSFDDCQAIIKTIFADLAFRDRYSLGSVNSINFARILAQVVYYFYAFFRVAEETGAERVQFAVPTGNFGDIFAGYLSMRMGLPVHRLILATNDNDILARFFATGVYRPRQVVPTLSPSMDIQVASNFERYLYYLAGADPERLRAWMLRFKETGTLDLAGESAWRDGPFVAGSAGREETLRTMRRYHDENDVLLDPHTAVGVRVAEGFQSAGIPTICLATAHPAKFPQAAREALGQDVPAARHPAISALDGLPFKVERVPAEASVVAGFVAEKVAEGAGYGTG